jgi:hypothetical protein
MVAAPSSQARHGRPTIRISSSQKHQISTPLFPPRYLVIGFMGGFVHHDNPARSEYKVAENLRAAFPARVQVETFENRREGKAYDAVLHFLDTKHDGALSGEEKKNARIILYGHSWGGAAVLKLARQLQKEDIPVLLTIQVDSVGRHDDVVPANVTSAVNFFQPNGLIHGQKKIRAADPARTDILGNFEIDYKNRRLDCRGYPWYERVFSRMHTQIGCDPSVWSHVELLIRSELPAPHSALK